MIEFTDLALTLHARPILRGVSGMCRAGAVTVILGANGAGKSMLLSCLAGLRYPDSGQLRLDGRVLGGWPMEERARRIGYLPQDSVIHWNMTGRALVALGRLPHRSRGGGGGGHARAGFGIGLGAGFWGRGDSAVRAKRTTRDEKARVAGDEAHESDESDEAAVARALAQVDCLHLAERCVRHMSGGERARLLLARILATAPDWILADEPLTNLDPAHQLDSLACLRRTAQEGAGVVLVLHDVTQAARIADHVIIMQHGAIIAAGAVAEVMTEAQLATAFGVASYIGCDRSGAPIIVPLARV